MNDDIDAGAVTGSALRAGIDSSIETNHYLSIMYIFFN